MCGMRPQHVFSHKTGRKVLNGWRTGREWCVELCNKFHNQWTKKRPPIDGLNFSISNECIHPLNNRTVFWARRPLLDELHRNAQFTVYRWAKSSKLTAACTESVLRDLTGPFALQLGTPEWNVSVRVACPWPMATFMWSWTGRRRPYGRSSSPARNGQSCSNQFISTWRVAAVAAPAPHRTAPLLSAYVGEKNLISPVITFKSIGVAEWMKYGTAVRLLSVHTTCITWM